MIWDVKLCEFADRFSDSGARAHFQAGARSRNLGESLVDLDGKGSFPLRFQVWVLELSLKALIGVYTVIL